MSVRSSAPGAPSNSAIADAAGDLFGTTEMGGAKGDGTVFELSGIGFQVADTTVALANDLTAILSWLKVSRG
jgi:uncharacterized repeat protein (TIGR03803 family)